MTKSSSHFPTDATGQGGRTGTVLRPASVSDLPRLAEIQTATWQRAYRGLVPDFFLDEEVPSLLRQHWSSWPKGNWRIVVAELAGFVQGFVALDLEYKGGPYIDNLHVAPGVQGQGLGLRLLSAVAQEALPHGRLWLTVMDGNDPARRFYARAGGTEDARIEDKLFALTVGAFPVAWDGAALQALADDPTTST